MSRSVIEVAGKKFRTENISRRVRKIVISPIKEMSILADLWQAKAPVRIISFGQGIPYWDTPKNIKRAIQKALTELDTSKYTLEPGITELRERIARELERSRGLKHVEANKEVMVTVGCQEAVDCALASLIDDGDEVLIPEPAFPSHIEQVIQFGGVPKFVSLATAAGWHLDPAILEKKITRRTRAILFSNPSNPTGMVLGLAELKALARIAKKHNLIVITDETYDFLTYEKTKFISPAAFPELKGRVILCGSFSKKYALTGYRVGFAYADEGLIDHMLKVHDALAICAPAISQKAAIEALKGSQQSVKDAVRRLTANRALMCAELDTMADMFEYQKPMGAYYILAKVKRPDINSFKLVLKILREANVILIPGAAFGPSGEGHVRFSFAGRPEDIKEGFGRLRRWVKEWQRKKYAL
jgi:aminotransferase